ncbi:MAG TPA: hypothetical protein VIV12_28365 [Streptosporangiaceae bacterium]
MGAARKRQVLPPDRGRPADRRPAGQRRHSRRRLARHFGVPKIYLLGHSYGTVLGTLAAQRHPGLHYAYIGTGQMFATTANHQIGYRALLGSGQRTGDTALVRQLRSWGEPPCHGQDVTRYTTIPQGDYADVGKLMAWSAFGIPKSADS